MKITALLIFWFLGGTTAQAACDHLDQRFHTLQRTYFHMLDYEANAADDIMKFENDLTYLTECGLGNPTANFALAYVYAALFLKNDSQGARGGYIAYESLIKYRKYSSGNSLGDEVTARWRQTVSYLQTALALLPGDRRIPGWLAGARAGLEFSERGVVSEETFSALINEVVAYPELNMLTALLALSEVPLSLEQEHELLSYTTDMTDILKSPCSPFKINPDVTCKNSDKVPHNLQNSINILSDVFLREAKRLSDADPQGNHWAVRTMALKAMLIHLTNTFPVYSGTADAWVRKDLLTERKKLIQKTIVDSHAAEAFWEKSWRERAYQCAACHAPEAVSASAAPVVPKSW